MSLMVKMMILVIIHIIVKIHELYVALFDYDQVKMKYFRCYGLSQDINECVEGCMGLVVCLDLIG